MLVIERGDRGAGGQPAQLLACSLRDARHRELEVVGNVPLAEPEKGQARFWSRQHHAPSLERLLERTGVGQPAAERRLFFVMDGVVREVAPAAQHYPRRAAEPQWLAESGDDPVEERAAAG